MSHPSRKVLLLCAAALALVSVTASRGEAREELCDSSFQDCRAPLLALMNAETTEIDVGLWFMTDARYSNLLVQKFHQGVQIRILMDPREYAQSSVDQQVMAQLQAAGIPMRKRVASGIEHWKAMIFASQSTVYFGSANFNPDAFVANQPYVNYTDETVYFTDDASVVNSFMTKFDDAWVDTTAYAPYANVTGALVRSYPISPIDQELNFPPGEDFANRSVLRYHAETQKIDVDMFRMTDQRHTNAIIAAAGRGVPIRVLVDPGEYRLATRLWDGWNVDRLYMAGIAIRVTVHQGLNHGKLVLLYGQGMSIFGSSNWTTPSADSQHEHNYFTTNASIFNWFVTYFERRWNNSSPTGAAETGPFTPLPPDPPVYQAPAKAGTVAATTGLTLVWDGGPWAHNYDIYFGATSTPPLYLANQNLGPDDPTKSLKQYQRVALPPLQPGTTYYWQIVSKTMANLTASGPVWSFTTPGTAVPPGVPSTPLPLDGSTNVSATPTFSWSADGASSFDVNFGSTNPPQIAATGLAAASYTPSALATTTTYYWQIVAHNVGGATPGPVWSFTTGSTPAPTGVPSPWRNTDIGAVGVKGAASGDGSGFTVSGSGADIWNAADAFEFVSQPLNGDGAIVAHVASVPLVNSWSKAGVMIRETVNPDAAFAFMLVSAAKGAALQYRTATAISAASAPIVGTKPPDWLKLVRAGNTIAAYQSADGATWQLMGSATIPMAASVNIGLAVSSHDNTRLVTATFDHVLVTPVSTAPQAPSAPVSPSPADAAMAVSATPTLTWSAAGAATYDVNFGTSNPPPRVTAGQTTASYTPSTLATNTPYYWQVVARNATGITTGPVWSFTTAAVSPAPQPPPAPWSDGDIGAVGTAGSASASGGSLTIAGAGADIWNTADAFHYLYQPLSGDGQIIARVASVQNVAAWSKAGVMIRDTLTPGSPYAFMLVSAGKGAAFQYRTSAGVSAAGAAGTMIAAPVWLKLVRSGAAITGYQSVDATTWQTVGTASVTLGSSVTVGIAVSSHTTAKAAQALVDNVTVTQGAPLPTNQPPTVSLTAPANGATFVAPADMILTASASDPENRLARVEFYAGSTLLGTATSAPYTWTWSAVPVGTYAVQAMAFDADGGVTSSTPATVTVSAPTTSSWFGIQSVFVIVMENHNWSEIVGNALAPYINTVLLPQAAHTEQYYNPPGLHPSLPNYLWLEAGQNFGVLDDGAPALHHQTSTQHLTTQLEAAGISWKAYEEGISGTTCPLTDTGLYAAKHDPFVYFDDVTDGNSADSAHCLAHIRPYGEFAGDLQQNAVPRYTFITPNLCHDMHDCGIDAGDQWLSTEVPPILNAAAYQHAVVFITWDESETADGPIGMIALSPAAKPGYATAIPYTHSSTLRTLQEIFGVTPLLGDAAAATDLSDLFTSAAPQAPPKP